MFSLIIYLIYIVPLPHTFSQSSLLWSLQLALSLMKPNLLMISLDPNSIITLFFLQLCPCQTLCLKERLQTVFNKVNVDKLKIPFR